jgi:hypothetical protein
VGERSDEIKKHIDTQRSELSENLERLEERVKSTTDWRAQIEKRPMTALGIAFGGGLLLGTMVPLARRSPAPPRYTTGKGEAGLSSKSYAGQGYTGSSEGTTGSHAEKTRRQPKSTATSRELRRTWDMLDTIRAAMVSYGAAKLKDYLGSVIPGFGEHYRRTEQEYRRNQDYSGQGTSSSASTGATGSTGTRAPS